MNCPTKDEPDRFWRWSCEFYARDNVKRALLRLQDEYRWNVNLTLWCLWRTRNAGPPTPEDIAAASGHITTGDHGLTASMRQVRRTATDLYPNDVTLKNALLAAELALERKEQALICEIETQNTAGMASNEASFDSFSGVLWQYYALLETSAENRCHVTSELINGLAKAAFDDQSKPD